jgi:hypothetical protein
MDVWSAALRVDPRALRMVDPKVGWLADSRAAPKDAPRAELKVAHLVGCLEDSKAASKAAQWAVSTAALRAVPLAFSTADRWAVLKAASLAAQ